jgi:alpha-tubulin suppressor-like RCC1 family protein
MRHDNPNLQGTVNLHKTITDIKSNPWNGAIVMADGVPHIIRGSNLTAYLEGTGLNYSGPLGAMNMHEVSLPETGSVQDIGAYGQSAFVLFTNGNLYTVGRNNNGQLGLGTPTTPNTTDRSIYTLSNTDVTRVFTDPSNADRDASDTRLIIQKTDGKIYGVGYNQFGQLGLPATQIVSSWTELTWCGTNPLSVWNMGALVGCTFCQRADGTVWAAGYNSHGQLGNGSTAQTVATAVNVTNNWLGGTFAATGMIIQRVMGGLGHSAGGSDDRGNITMFMDNGTQSRIASAGNNTDGTIGNGLTGNTNISTPVTPTGFSGRVRQIGRMGDTFGSVWVLRTDGTLWNWGHNGSGQLGRNNTTNSGTPTQVLTGVTQLFNEYYKTYTFGPQTTSPIIETASGYFIAGANFYSNLAVGDNTDRRVFTRMLFPLGIRLSKVGSMSTLGDGIARYAVDTNGNFYVWGYNVHNGCFDSQATNISIPVRISPPALVR